MNVNLKFPLYENINYIYNSKLESKDYVFFKRNSFIGIKQSYIKLIEKIKNLILDQKENSFPFIYTFLVTIC